MPPSAQADGQGQSSALPRPVRFPIARAFCSRQVWDPAAPLAACLKTTKDTKDTKGTMRLLFVSFVSFVSLVVSFSDRL